MYQAFQLNLKSICGSDSKESACNAGDPGSIPGSGRSPGEENGKPLQYSCLENPMDRGAWQATVHRVAKSRTRLKWLSTYAHMSGKDYEQMTMMCVTSELSEAYKSGNPGSHELRGDDRISKERNPGFRWHKRELLWGVLRQALNFLNAKNKL